MEECKSLRLQGRLFSVPKRETQERRVILDLSYLNKFIRCDHFKMTTITQVRTLLSRGPFTCSLDLSDAFWHIPIAPHFRPYLAFALGRRRFRFKAMPFGLNIAPRIFTKLANCIVKISAPERNTSCGISGRLAILGTVQGNVSGSFGHGHLSSNTPRILHKIGKVSPNPGPSLRMARPPLGSRLMCPRLNG